MSNANGAEVAQVDNEKSDKEVLDLLRKWHEVILLAVQAQIQKDVSKVCVRKIVPRLKPVSERHQLYSLAKNFYLCRISYPQSEVIIDSCKSGTEVPFLVIQFDDVEFVVGKL